MHGHKIDYFGRCMAGGHYKITFVFTVFIIHHNHKFPLADILNGTIYGI